VALRQHAALAELQHVAQAQAVALKWHLADPVAVQLQAADQAVALKSLLAIHAELHPATADVAQNASMVVCSLRFSSAKATAAATQLQAVTPVAALQVVAALVAVHQYPHQWLLQWLHQHQLLTHMLT
jgi:hypothetical protein